MSKLFYALYIILTLIIGLSAIYRLSYKADLPFKYHPEDKRIVSDSAFKEIQVADQIVSIDDHPVRSLLETEFILDRKHISETVTLKVMSGNETSISKTVTVRLNDYYHDISFILITLIIGLSYWLTGVYVYVFGKNEIAARILCLTLVTFSLAMFTSPCFYGSGNDWMGYLIRLSHASSYILGGLFFLHFTLIFPNVFSRKQVPVIKFSHSFAAVFSIITACFLYISMRDLDMNYLRIYSFLWDLSQFILLSAIISGAIILIVKYRKLFTKKEKTKLEWIFWGLAAGVSPFLILWLVPSIFGLQFLVIEEIILSFLILIPISFSIAVVKYQLFDIEVVIKRSIIYSLMLVLMLTMYFGIIYGLSFLTGKIIGEDSKIFNIIAVVIIALAFNPARLKLKGYVDLIFYRQKYSFDKAIRSLNQKITKCDTIKNLGEILIKEINDLIPVKSIAVCILTPDGERLRLIAHNNFENMSIYIQALRAKKVFSRFVFPFAVSDKVEKNVNIDDSLESVLKRWDICLGIPLLLESENVMGVILTGSKLSGLKYSADDVELLGIIGSTASMALKRLQLQEQIIKEEIEISNLKEINDMKSYFVATVSHDLKTPLSSIKMFSDLLGNENISIDKKQEYLKYIDGESDRLNRMINNILNYAKMERGIKNYNFRKINVNSVLSKVLKDMNYDLLLNKFEVDLQIGEEEIFIKGDPDDINSLFENMLSNAIKYSGSTKYLKVTSYTDNENACITIEDRGIGISDENLKNIFDPYYRGNKTEESRIRGTGLGLAIVKNIADAHSGKIEVGSELNKGSVFKIILPLYKNED